MITLNNYILIFTLGVGGDGAEVTVEVTYRTSSLPLIFVSVTLLVIFKQNFAAVFAATQTGCF